MKTNVTLFALIVTSLLSSSAFASSATAMTGETQNLVHTNITAQLPASEDHSAMVTAFMNTQPPSDRDDA